jgi:hypothetical protein
VDLKSGDVRAYLRFVNNFIYSHKKNLYSNRLLLSFAGNMKKQQRELLKILIMGNVGEWLPAGKYRQPAGAINY